MKNLIMILISICYTFVLQAQGFIGAWESTTSSENGDVLKNVLIFANGYQVMTTYDAITGKFIHTNGGFWKLEDNIMTETIEFHTDLPELVGTQESFEINKSDNEFEILDTGTK